MTPFTRSPLETRIKGPAHCDTVWINDEYTVFARQLDPLGEGIPPMIHLSIKRNDREPIHDWRVLQEIKNELVGAEAEAVELYPAESRLVDTANQYHLWCLPPGQTYGFGFHDGRIVSSDPDFEEKRDEALSRLGLDKGVVRDAKQREHVSRALPAQGKIVFYEEVR
jgi:hypothetical protein